MKKTFVVGIILLFAVWGAVTLLHLYDAFFLPNPIEVLTELGKLLFSGALNADIYFTLLRLGEAFALAAIIGIPIGLALGASTKAFDSMEFLVEFLRSIPPISIFPLFMLIFGIDDTSKVAVAAFGAALIIIFNTTHGVMNSKKSRIIAAKLMGATKTQIFKKIIFWESLPQTFIGLRTGLSMALIIIIVTEMFIGTQFGLGRRIIDFQYIYNVKGLFGVIILTGIIGYAINMVFAFVEKRVIHWNGK
ncbi:MAG: ABC transporter permease [Candidatus Diapherotrites archaeon]|nr:ABC transporter permease [Candidatus Diapherotrites archaeon]